MDMAKPKIRFKGYTDEWEQRKLGEVCLRVQGNDGRMDLPTLTISAANGWMKQEDRFSGNIAGKEQKNYTLLHKGELSYNHGNSKLAKYGTVFSLQTYEEALVPRVYHSFKIEDGNADFLEYYFATKLPDRELGKLISSGARMDGLLNIGYDEFMGIQMVFPSIAEQNRVASYFRCLDTFITLHQRKCEQAKKLKKYMLQKMFPQNGQKVPEIRFKGFTDDWEQRKFSDCYKMSSGYAFKMSDYCDEGVGLINGESIQHGIINDDNLNHLPESFVQHYPDFLLKENDIVVGLNRPITNGNLKIARIPSKYNDSLLYQRAGKIVYKTDCDKDFTYVLLSQEILKHTLVEAVGSDQPFISTSKLDGWKMMMPSDIEEQVKIGEYFQKLDYLITLHQQKCDELKNIKKFMLQNMFM